MLHCKADGAAFLCCRIQPLSCSSLPLLVVSSRHPGKAFPVAFSVLQSLYFVYLELCPPSCFQCFVGCCWDGGGAEWGHCPEPKAMGWGQWCCAGVTIPGHMDSAAQCSSQSQTEKCMEGSVYCLFVQMDHSMNTGVN